MKARDRNSLLRQHVRGRNAGISLIEIYVWDPRWGGAREFMHGLVAVAGGEESQGVQVGDQVLVVGFGKRPRDLAQLAAKYLDECGAPAAPEPEAEAEAADGSLSSSQMAEAKRHLRELGG